MIGLVRCVGSGSASDPFRPQVEGLVGAIDLRPDCTVVDGWWIVRADQPEVVFGDDGDEGRKPTVTRRRAIENRLGITLADRPLRRLIADLLVEHGDDADPRRWNSLKAAVRGRGRVLEVWLGGLLWELPIPAGGATITDDFNRADSTNIGGAWSEVAGNAEIVSNLLRSAVADTFTRVRTTGDLDSADHYAQITLASLNTAGATVKRIAPMVRYATSADTAYEWRREIPTSGVLADALLRWFKVVAGSYTQLSSTVDTAAAGEVLRGEVSGSTLTGLRDGVTKESLTDTSITTGTKAGVMFYAGTAAGRITGDNFAAADLTAPSGVERAFVHTTAANLPATGEVVVAGVIG